jgi:hypothetical protein
MYTMQAIFTLGLAAAMLMGTVGFAQDSSALFSKFDTESDRKGKKKKKRKRKPAAQRHESSGVSEADVAAGR